MRDEYNIKDLNPRKNPYIKKSKKQITINIDTDTITYFKKKSAEYDIPYQVLINLYLYECVKEKKELEIAWK